MDTAPVIGQSCVWTSLQGYSNPGEIVRVIGNMGNMVHIISSPDEGEPGDGFSYWVHRFELTQVEGP